MIHGERGTKSAAGISGGRLNPDAIEPTVAKDFAVGNTVQCDATRETEIAGTAFGRGETRHATHHFFGDHLDRCGEIHVSLHQPFVGRPRRTTEERVKALARHRESGAVVEVGQVETERSVVLQVDQVLEDQRRILGSPYGASPMTLYSPEFTLNPV